MDEWLANRQPNDRHGVYVSKKRPHLSASIPPRTGGGHICVTTSVSFDICTYTHESNRCTTGEGEHAFDCGYLNFGASRAKRGTPTSVSGKTPPLQKYVSPLFLSCSCVNV